MAVSERALPRVSEEAYLRIARLDREASWELVDGLLREKPGMNTEHNYLAFELGHRIRVQLDDAEYQVRVDSSRVRRSTDRYFIPNVLVVPTAWARSRLGKPGTVETFTEPLPFVAEIWSPSTGGYDVDPKLPEHLARGDREVWRVHPYDRTVRAWHRQPDGTYAETDHGPDATIPLAVLPGVTIDLASLFAFLVD